MALPFLIYLSITPFLVRHLGHAGYGLLMLFMAMPAIFLSFDFGLVAGGIFSIGQMLKTRENARAMRLQRELMTVFLLLGAAICGGIWLLAPKAVDWLSLAEAVSRPQAIRLLRIGACCLFITFISECASMALRALEQFPLISAIKVCSRVVFWLGAALILYLGFSLEVVAAWFGAVSAGMLAAYVGWSLWSRLPLAWAPTIQFREAGSIAPFCAFAFIAQATSAVTFHADKVIISHFMGPAAFTYYSVAVDTASRFLGLGAALTYFVFPRAASLSPETDKKRLQDLYRNASRLNILILAPLVVAAAALASPLMRIWLGPGFDDRSALPLQLLCAAYFITSLSVVPSYIYTGMGNSKIGAAYAAAGAAVNVAVCLTLTPILGIVGAAIAVLLGVLQSAVFMGSLENRLGLGWFRVHRELFAKVAATAAGQAAFLRFLHPWLNGWPQLIAAGASSWLLFNMVWFSVFASESDRSVLSRLLQRTWLGGEQVAVPL